MRRGELEAYGPFITNAISRASSPSHRRETTTVCFQTNLKLVSFRLNLAECFQRSKDH